MLRLSSRAAAPPRDWAPGDQEGDDMINRNLLAFAFTAIFAGGLYAGTASAGDDGEITPCKATSFKVAQVKKACEKGGVKAAKKLMKSAVKKAKDAGESVNCKTCHESTKELHKNKGAESVKKLKELL